MENLLQLAGGISHDLNNVLTVIRGYAETIVHDPLSPHHQSALEILTACSRAISLAGHLLAFTPQPGHAPLKSDASALFHTAAKLLSRLIGEDISFTTEQSQNLGQIRVHPGVIEHLLIGAALKARLLLPQGGELRLQATLADLQNSKESLPAGKYVLFEVDAPNAAIPWEPNELQTYRGLAASNGGFVQMEKSLRLYLPFLEEASPASPEAKAWQNLPGGEETILLVEDDAALLTMSAMILKQLGYKVFEAPNGEEALRIAQQHGDQIIDLIITDLILPKMSGQDLATWILSLHPEANILYTSGYQKNGTPNSNLPSQANFLPKPFSLEDLAHAVRQALQSPMP